MFSFSVTAPGKMLFDSATPDTDYDTGAQKHTEDGIPMWKLNILLKQPDARRCEPITVKTAMKGNPSELIEEFTQVEFDGFCVRSGASNNGGNWLSFAADAVRPANKNAAAAARPQENK